MREIKFRAGDGLMHEPRGFERYQGRSLPSYARLEFAGMDIDIPNLILMQFTGLKDKNGKEIYEGDIVRLQYWTSTGRPCPNCGHVTDGAKSFEVKFEAGTFGLDASPEFENLVEFGDKTEIEVIGNIYENPALLK